MMPAGHHSDCDSTLLPLPKSSITWFGGIFARLPPLAARLTKMGLDRRPREECAVFLLTNPSCFEVVLITNFSETLD